ncbi:hypothetical protein [Chryseobacterium sp.]|uniref:hypothetical protein n=1 Tax=Chryseobacterium sp. TaxID=1871047 RepID=UPI00261FFF4A|nr:hypothetical protein [Chryseobacterium sp.]
MNKEIDIKNIIKFLKYNLPDKSLIRSNLDQINPGKWESKTYYKFVDSTSANQLGSELIFKENIIPEHPTLYTIVLDIIGHDQLGGIEFMTL